MSRVLVLLPSLPSPLDSGAKIRNHGLLELLREEHTVDAIAFDESRPRSTVRRVLDMATSELPDMALRLWSPEFMCKLRSLIRETKYDVVQAEGIEMARYLSAAPPNVRVYDAHNAEFLLQRRFATSGSLMGRLYSRLQWRRLERFERGIVCNSRLTLAVSNHDANQLMALAAADAHVEVVPNGIDCAAYPFCPPGPEVRPNLLFVGKLDFRPNAEALRWFTGEVLQHLPEARVFAVGARPPEWLVRLGQRDDRIVATGYVEGEQPYLRRCAALVLPLQVGTGSRLKALVAMASGLPIVSTRVGMEGLDAEPERDYLLAGSPSEWIAAIRRLMTHADLRRQLTRNARQLVERRYDWKAIRPQLQSAYARL